MNPWRGFGIDHVVHVARDLDAAGAFFEALGFTVSGVNQHPFGTENRLIVFENTFLEIIRVRDAVVVPPAQENVFPFPQIVQDTSRRYGDGFHMLALRGNEVEADTAQVKEGGFDAYTPLRFRRDKADGTAASFALWAPKYPDTDSPIFHSIHENPRSVYGVMPEHANGALGISGAIFASDSPADHHAYLGAVSGQRDMQSSSFGVRFTLPDSGTLSVLSAESHESHLGVKPELDGTRLRATSYEVSIGRLDVVRDGLARLGIEYAERGERIIVRPEDGFGATVQFAGA